MDETTTIETITDAQIRELRSEAGAAGDEEMVDTCDDATDHRRHLGIRRRAREICAAMIREAETRESFITDGEMDELRAAQRGRILGRLDALAVLATLERFRTPEPSLENTRLEGMAAVLRIAALEPDLYRDGDLNPRYAPLLEAYSGVALDAFIVGWNLGLNLAGGR